MTYEELPPISRAEFRSALEDSKPEEIARAILRMSLHEPDQNWAENQCLKALQDRRLEVKAAALKALGHLARTHRGFLHSGIMEELRRLRSNPELAGLAEDALDDVQIFAGSQAKVN